jgi:hypothetical protein
LEPGDTLELENTNERITIRPRRETMPLRQERGVWVYRSGKPLPEGVAEETLRTLRDEREHRLTGSRLKDRG